MATISISVFLCCSFGAKYCQDSHWDFAGRHTATRKTLQWQWTIILEVLHVHFNQLGSFFKALHHFIQQHTQRPWTLPLIPLAVYLLFVKFCLVIPVIWSALSRWKRHFKAGCVDGDELTEKLAHRPVVSIAFHGCDIHTKALHLSSSQAEGGKSCDRAAPTHALSFHSSLNANCDKETTFLKQEHIIPYESFPKNEVHIDNIPFRGTLHFSFPPEASLVIHIQNKYWM